jgi:hypothetical protein
MSFYLNEKEVIINIIFDQSKIIILISVDYRLINTLSSYFTIIYLNSTRILLTLSSVTRCLTLYLKVDLLIDSW